MSSALAVSAALATAVAVGSLLRLLAPPPRALGGRLHPYLSPTRAGLRSGAGSVGKVFGPMVGQLAGALGRLIDHRGEATTVIRLRQTGWYPQLTEEEMLGAHRLAQLRGVVLATIGAAVVGQALSLDPAPRLALLVAGLVVGATRQRGRVERAIEERREVMRIEIYTIDQLLAVRVRAGGGVVAAVQATVSRGSGEVISELGDALRLHRSGWRAADAFRRMAEITPEPFCSRTYRLLAAAEERGADLAAALLDLAEEVRESRREMMRRSATRRRAAMLIPTIAILAPVLILFVAAPLPYLITGWR